MPTKLLIPLDGSEGAMRAVEFVANTFGHTPEVEITLIHILPVLPPSLWDDGHVLSEAEHQEREGLIANWEKEQEKQWQGIFVQARDMLTQAGIAAEAIHTKFQPQYGDIAEDILDEAELEGHSTIVIGRRGLTGAKKFFLGSVSHKIVNHARGQSVIIVDHAQISESLESRSRSIQEWRTSIFKAKSKQGCWEKFIYLSKYGRWLS
jgi:nucleotide-binding universal stress UspA family protein